jgi:hypothetical protein
MKYLVLSVDPFGIPLRIKDDFARSSWPIHIPSELQSAILEWNGKFSKIIASEHLYTQKERLELRNELNEQGFQLADQISRLFTGGVHVDFIPE